MIRLPPFVLTDTNMLKNDRKIAFEIQIPRIILFGIVWGLLELFLNPLLKDCSRALAGISMPFFSVVFILSVKHRIPAGGTVFLAAVIAAMIKYFFAGMVLSGGFMAILIEAALIEALFLLSGLCLWGYISAGILVQLYSAFHPYITKGLLCQSAHFVFFRKFVLDSFHLNLQRAALIAVLLSLHIIAGFLSGCISWRLAAYFRKVQH